jgi:hypothetical protein
MRSVGCGTNEHLHERQHVQITGGAVFVEGVNQVRAVDRNTEGHIAEPDRSLDEIFLVAEKAAKRHLRVIGQKEQATDGDQAQDDRGDQHRENPTAFITVDPSHGIPHEDPHGDGKPDRQRRERVHNPNAHARQCG